MYTKIDSYTSLPIFIKKSIVFIQGGMYDEYNNYNR